MSANTLAITPRFAKAPAAVVSAATTDQTGATAANIVLLYAATVAGAPPADGQGAILTDVTITIPATNVASVVMLFKRVAGTYYPLRTWAIPAVTAGTTVPGYTLAKQVINETVAPGDGFGIATTIAQGTYVTGNIGEY